QIVYAATCLHQLVDCVTIDVTWIEACDLEQRANDRRKEAQHKLFAEAVFVDRRASRPPSDVGSCLAAPLGGRASARRGHCEVRLTRPVEPQVQRSALCWFRLSWVHSILCLSGVP